MTNRMPVIRLDNDDRKRLAKNLIDQMPAEPVRQVKFVLAESQRTIAQNALMWTMLGQLNKYARWYGQKLHSEGWKDLLTAGLKEQETIPGINGGLVALGERTSKMSIKKMIELIEFMYWFGNCQPRPNGLSFCGFIEKDIPPEQLQYLERAE